MPRSSGVKLVAHDGYALGADCDLGGVALTHWLTPDPRHPGRYVFSDTPYVWPLAADAFAALEIDRGQE